MMLERFTGDARGVVVGARDAAAGLGHNWIGCEHLLLALASAGGPVAAVLRDEGVTPERVRTETVRLVGAGRGVSLFDLLDRDALASIGIDVDAVRDKVEAAFGPDALVPPRPRPRPRARRWGRRLAQGARRASPWPTRTIVMRVPGPPGKAAPDDRPGGSKPCGDHGRIPFTPRAKTALMHAVREARAEHSGQIGVEHLGLAIVSMTDGAVPPILAAIGAPGSHLRTQILSRYRQAS
jgi:ATP-dependent Clp protease ATP-binding subunit ClpA